MSRLLCVCVWVLVQADVYERLHENMEARITHTGKISSNVEAKFGLSTIYGHTEDKRAFNAVCREYTEKLAENFQQSEWLMFAANEPFSMAVKHGDPIIGVPPHSQWFGNLQIPFVGRGSNVDRRLLTVHFCVPVKNADMTFKSKLFNEELLTLIVKGAWAYREFTGAYSDVGIWSAGVLPRYFQLQRDLNQVCFFSDCYYTPQRLVVCCSFITSGILQSSGCLPKRKGGS